MTGCADSPVEMNDELSGHNTNPGVELLEDVPGGGAPVETKVFYDFRVRMWLSRGDQSDGASHGACTIEQGSRTTEPPCSRRSESTAFTCLLDSSMESKGCELVVRAVSASPRTSLTETLVFRAWFLRMLFSRSKFMSWPSGESLNARAQTIRAPA